MLLIIFLIFHVVGDLAFNSLSASFATHCAVLESILLIASALRRVGREMPKAWTDLMPNLAIPSTASAFACRFNSVMICSAVSMGYLLSTAKLKVCLFLPVLARPVKMSLPIRDLYSPGVRFFFAKVSLERRKGRH